MVSVLFVCMGNICRSPAAEGILRHMAAKAGVDIEIKSCGLGSWHVGSLPDLRMQEAAKRRGVVLSSRAQMLQPGFFDDFDYILAADHEVLNILYQQAKTAEQKNKVHLITAFSSSYKNQDVQDPFYSEEMWFDHVLDVLEDSCQGLLDKIQSK